MKRDEQGTETGFAPEVQKAYLRAMQSIDPQSIRYLEAHPEASLVLKQLQLEEVLSQNFGNLKK